MRLFRLQWPWDVICILPTLTIWSERKSINVEGNEASRFWQSLYQYRDTVFCQRWTNTCARTPVKILHAIKYTELITTKSHRMTDWFRSKGTSVGHWSNTPAGCPGPYPGGFCRSSRKKTPQPLWTTCACALLHTQ